MPNFTNSFNDITDSEITINLPKHIIPKVLTDQIGLANDIDFVGRKEDLQKVDELLNQKAKGSDPIQGIKLKYNFIQNMIYI
jgi:hypothetical protein